MDPIEWKQLTSNVKILEPSFRLSRTKDSGRGLVATRMIAQDEILFQEVPLVVGPPQNVTLNFCCGCNQKENMLKKLFVECPNKCGLLMCSEKCDLKVRHNTIECDLLKSKLNGRCPNPGKWLTVFRCFLLKMSENDSKWSTLQLLEDHIEDRRNCSIMNRNSEDVVKPIVNIFGSEAVTSKDIIRVCGILDSNSFRIDGNGTRGLFGLGSMMNHNCCPNARVVFGPDFNLTLRAKREIQPGEEICITYCSPLLGTPARLKKLMVSKFFTCLCKRCEDPVEMGSYLSSLRCPKCQANISPRDPFRGLSDDSEWRCSDCKFVTSEAKVQKLLAVVEKGIKEMIDDEQVTISQMEEILKKREKVLSPCHYLLLDLKLELVNRYEKVGTEQSVERRLQLLRERIETLKLVEGGLSRLEGCLHYRYQSTLVEKVTLLQKASKLDNNTIIQIGKEIKNSLQIAGQCLLGDVGCPPDLPNIIKSMYR